MIQFPGWLLHKQQQYFFAGTGAGIGDSYTHLRIFHLYIAVGKGRIAQTKSKRKTRTDIFLFKPAVADIDSLTVFLVFQIAVSIAECTGAWVIFIAHRPGVGQPAARRNLTGQDIGHGTAALHAALPVKQHRIDTHALERRKVECAAAVKHQNQFFVMIGKPS